MAKRKIFVSYKYKDSDVFDTPVPVTARSYVDCLIKVLEDSEIAIYKGEQDGNDLSKFQDSTIETKLKEKIRDSSITIVLISPNMRKKHTPEEEQWIPWEISYSLKEITRAGRSSRSNGILAIVLPDKENDYQYVSSNPIFTILKKNFSNLKASCSQENLPESYIIAVKWSDFITNPAHWIEKAAKNMENIGCYDISKEV